MSKSLLKNFSALFSLQLANYFIPLLTLPFLVRTLGVDSFGQLGFSIAFVQYFVLITDYGFNLSATHQIALLKEKREISKVFWGVMLSKAILALVSFFVLLVLIVIFPELQRVKWILISSCFFIVAGLLFPVWLFQGKEEMGAVALFSFLGRLVFVPVIFFTVSDAEDAWLAALLQSAGGVLSGIFSMYFVYKKNWIEKVSVNLNDVKRLMREGWHVFVSGVAVNIYTSTIPVVLGFLLGSAAVGVFLAADKIRQAVQGLTVPLGQVLFPRISSMVSANKDAARRLLWHAFLIQLAFGSFLSAGLMLFASEIVVLMYGQGHLDIERVVFYMGFLPLIVALTNVFGVQALLAFGMKKLFGRIVMAAALICILSLPIFIYYFSVLGAVASIILTEMFVLIFMGFYAVRLGIFKVRYFYEV